MRGDAGALTNVNRLLPNCIVFAQATARPPGDGWHCGLPARSSAGQRCEPHAASSFLNLEGRRTTDHNFRRSSSPGAIRWFDSGQSMTTTLNAVRAQGLAHCRSPGHSAAPSSVPTRAERRPPRAGHSPQTRAERRPTLPCEWRCPRWKLGRGVRNNSSIRAVSKTSRRTRG